ncbi:hypothetical protein DC31_10675 [Microbacterium sp. CH12i]|nr:hypothetical protein DC31_10675 [Microbacterium sp. CH12i]
MNRIRMLALLALAAGTLSACTPAPEPTPTPTAAFASEAEAFAAAEEVYRAYLMAAAQRAEGDATAAPEAYLSGPALEADLQAQRDLKSKGIRIVGASTIRQFVGLKADVNGMVALVSAEVCVDISESRILDQDDSDITPLNRPQLGKLDVEFSGDATELLISTSLPSEDSEC